MGANRMKQTEASVYDFRRVLIAALCLPFVAASVTMAQPVKAFPTAEGLGANAVGGRGGRVLEVTNLDLNELAGDPVPRANKTSAASGPPQ